MLDKLHAPWSIVLLLGVLAAIAGFALALSRQAPAMVTFGLAVGGCTIAGLAALEMAWSERWLAAALVGAALLAFPLAVVVRAAQAPPIHDLTTDPTDPPVFVLAAAQPANQGRDLDYPEGSENTAELQRRHYPELQPLRLAAPAPRVLERARLAARDQGWTLLPATEATVAVDGESGFEAYARTPVFGFIDDIAVRVRATEEGSRVDVRSTSRDGTGDLGSNARRIHAFLNALEAGPEAGESP